LEESDARQVLVEVAGYHGNNRGRHDQMPEKNKPGFCVGPSLEVSPDGKTLASGGEAPEGSGEVLLWRAAAGRKLTVSAP
jgi:hypothetical protein